MNTLLRVERLGKSFGALAVTCDVSFDVKPGECHAIIGPNGAGKTTLINQLSGNLAADAGNIVFDGADITALGMPDRVRLGLARSFQITSILPNFSVLENVAIAVQAREKASLSIFGRVACEHRLNVAALRFLKMFNLADLQQVRADRLSHGQKRQLEMAIALATDPKMLLLDEPLAGTSHEEAKRIVSLLRDLKGSVSMLLVEHDMDAVFSLADRISVLVYGRLIATGSPSEIRENAAVRSAYLGEELS